MAPPVKRSDQRRRRNKVDIDRAPNVTRRRGPDSPEWLGGLARNWYESLRTSGQSVFYTPADWQTALLAAKAVMAFDDRPSADMLRAIVSMCGSLAVTEGDRRRLRIELERAAEDPDERAADADVLEWRDRLSS